MHEIVGFVRSYLTQWSLSGQKKTSEILAREIVAILATTLQVEEPTVARAHDVLLGCAMTFLKPFGG